VNELDILHERQARVAIYRDKVDSFAREGSQCRQVYNCYLLKQEKVHSFFVLYRHFHKAGIPDADVLLDLILSKSLLSHAHSVPSLVILR
jgi:hypothetical protein